MSEDRLSPDQDAPQLQEALDTIAHTFNYPSSFSVHCSATGRTKRTKFELETPDGTSTYELQYAGRDDDEPELTRLD